MLGNNNMCWLIAKIAGGLFLVYLHILCLAPKSILKGTCFPVSIIGGSISFHRLFLQAFVLGNVCGVCVPFCKKLLRSRI